MNNQHIQRQLEEESSSLKEVTLTFISWTPLCLMEIMNHKKQCIIRFQLLRILLCDTYQVISVAHAMSTHCVKRKHQKNLWFLSPTQFPSHGQWWSYRRTHRQQSSQCLARRGCNIAQYPQRRSLDPPRGGVAKILQDSWASSPSDWLSESCSSSVFYK